MTLVIGAVNTLPSAAWNALRLPYVLVRLLLETPAALGPTLLGLSALTWAWSRGRPDPSQSEWRTHVAGLLLGALTIGWFLRGGAIDWSQTTDWQKEWAYFSALRQAVTTNTMPYLMPGSFQGTERYLANLETVVAPHAVLLKVVSIPRFFLLHALVMVIAGFAALAGLRRELQLSAFTWGLLVALFMLNGHVTGHLAAGHTQWTGYFLLPWILLVVIRLGRGDVGRGNTVTLALGLAGTIVIGAWHVFVWSLIFVATACLTGRTRMTFLLRAMVLVAGLSAIRLAPALLTFGTGSNSYLGDFSGPAALLAGLVGEPGAVSGPLDWVEYNTFIGWTGLAVLGVGLLELRSPLWWPSLVLITLSMGGLYGITLFHLPGFVSERVSSRLAIVGVLGFLVAGCARIDRWPAVTPSRWRPDSLAVLMLSWLAVLQLVLRAEQTRPRAASGPEPSSIYALKVMPIGDSYWWAVWIGAGITVATSVALIVVWWLGRRRGPPALPTTVTKS